MSEKTADQVRLTASQKVFVDANGLCIPFREISLSPSKAMDGTLEQNPPVRVYDTSGPWTDPGFRGDVRDGLPPLRRDWIIQRDDVEEYDGRKVLPQDNGYVGAHLTNGSASRNGELEEFPGLRRAPLRAKAG